MSLLVTGSIGIDTVETPHGTVKDVLGGSSTYFSLAASLFAPVRLVGVVGEDFDPRLFEPLRRRGNIDLSGVETRPGSKTFRWHGRYVEDMNQAETVGVELNVLAEDPPTIPEPFRDSAFVFLANTHPAIQRTFAEQLSGAELIVCDTIDLWIRNEREALLDVLRRVHGMVLNDAEARMLTGERNLITAGRAICKLGPRFVVIKKGEHGSLLVFGDELFALPAYPTEKTIDPTGCGDTFAGGMMGYLTSLGRWDAPALRSAMARGTVVASFVIESFSIDALAAVTPEDVERRLNELRRFVEFD